MKRAVPRPPVRLSAAADRTEYRGGSGTDGRGIGGLLISTSIIGANFVDSTPLVIAFLALAFFGNGLASITWSLVSTLAPARLLGLTGGVFNFIGNLSAITTPIVIGFLATGDSFAPAITYISVLALLGALSYILLVGKVERIEL